MEADGSQVQDQLVEHSGTCLKVKIKFDKKIKLLNCGAGPTSRIMVTQM